MNFRDELQRLIDVLRSSERRFDKLRSHLHYGEAKAARELQAKRRDATAYRTSGRSDRGAERL